MSHVCTNRIERIMSLISENVIPGNHGKIFGTNASTDEQMNEIKRAVEKVGGVKDVFLVKEVFPKEFIVHTAEIVSVHAIEEAVKSVGLHAISKGYFLYK